MEEDRSAEGRGRGVGGVSVRPFGRVRVIFDNVAGNAASLTARGETTYRAKDSDANSTRIMS